MLKFSQAKCACLVVAILEYFSRVNGTNQIYSEQNLVDCDKNNFGCGGGLPTVAMVYIITNGIASGSTYKYVSRAQTCQTKKYPSIYFAPNACYIMGDGSDDNLMTVLLRFGPVAVAIREEHL